MFGNFSEMGEDAIGHLLISDEELNPDGFGDMSVVATADGCRVEPDGQCEHGYESPLRRLGLI